MNNISQSSISVSVDFYNDDEKEKLLRYPTMDNIQSIVDNGIEIPTAEFLTYYLFKRKRPGKEGYRGYQQLGLLIHRSLIDLKDWVLFNGNSICSAQDIGEMDISITEKIGESISLSVMNRIHGMTEADWGKIPERRGRGAYPVFDYSHSVDSITGSDGQYIVQVESKGSSVLDNRKISASISNHKANILNKKYRIDELEQQNSYPHEAGLRYGSITAIDQRQNGIIKCRLVDPAPEHSPILPQNLQLINRVRFLYDWISFISPRSQLSSSLATRLAALETLENPFELDKTPLYKGNGENFSIFPFDVFSHQPCGFFSNKSYVTDGPSGGVTLQLPNREMLFIGIMEDLIFQALDQNFENILSYEHYPGSISKRVRCFFSKGRYDKLILPDHVEDRVIDAAPYKSFDLFGELHYSREGTVFGILHFEQRET